MNTHCKNVLHYCKLFMKNYFYNKSHFPIQNKYDKNTLALKHPLNHYMQVRCTFLPCRTNEANIQEHSMDHTTLPTQLHYPAHRAWDVHMPIYLHLSSARFLLHTMMMMIQTMSTIKIAPTTIAIIMMRCSLSSLPHQLISTARKEQ